MRLPNATVLSAAAAHGFDVVGITSGAPVEDALRALEAACRAGHHAAMAWLARNPPERADPRTLLEETRTVVSVAVHHGPPEPFEDDRRHGRIARYAWGRDYHDLMLPRLRALADELVGALPGATRARAACDHSPILERAFAVRAGVGFFGKHTCLLMPRGGSTVLLGEVLLDVDVEPTLGDGADHCGTCTRCLDACPTRAFPAPYVLDARRCISYLTIEHKGPLPREDRSALGPWVFGCDVCQEVCPFNRFAPPTPWPELEADAGAGPRLDLADVLAIGDDEAFAARFGNTPLLRPRRRGLLRNAAVVARNVGATAAVPALIARVTEDPEALVRSHALWALFGLAPEQARRLAERALTVDADPWVVDEARQGLDGAAG